MSGDDVTAGLPRVLCVDDEPNVLAALCNTLRRRFDVTTAEGGQEGLRILATHPPFAAVTSDFRMPQMNGAEFLAHARLVAPDTVRVLLTGQASLESVMSCVNQGHIFRLLTKPCATPDLLRTLDAAVDQFRMVTGDRLLLQRKIDDVSGHLLRAERLATLGTMAAAVGHELGNILTVLAGARAIIEEDLAAGRRPGNEEMIILRQAEEHLTVHAKNLLQLGRPAQDEARADLRVAVDSVIGMLRSAGVLRQPRLRLNLTTGPVEVRARRSEIEQALLNLIKNAVEALEESGQDDPEIGVSIETEPSHAMVTCRVTDNAAGIAPEKIPHLFEPYYTSKSAEKGTGLGLFVVRQIARAAGGDISVDSELGRGTAFTLTLAAISAPRGDASPARERRTSL